MYWGPVPETDLKQQLKGTLKRRFKVLTRAQFKKYSGQKVALEFCVFTFFAGAVSILIANFVCVFLQVKSTVSICGTS